MGRDSSPPLADIPPRTHLFGALLDLAAPAPHQLPPHEVLIRLGRDGCRGRRPTRLEAAQEAGKRACSKIGYTRNFSKPIGYSSVLGRSKDRTREGGGKGFKSAREAIPENNTRKKKTRGYMAAFLHFPRGKETCLEIARRDRGGQFLASTRAGVAVDRGRLSRSAIEDARPRVLVSDRAG